MPFLIALTFYRLLLPLLFATAFPGWVVKMLKRGGLGTRLGERASVYTTPLEYEPCGAIHVHAVSVGESMLALKLIREWKAVEPEARFVLATGTATGHAVATAAALPGLRVTYAPLDFRWMVRRYLKRFEPSQIVLVEGEIWPNLMLACCSTNIPVRLVNARMSPRSARRIRKFASVLRPFYKLLDAVALQEPGDREIWETLGVAPWKIHETGSLKFDPGSGTQPARREEFQAILDAFGRGRPVLLAASTHAGEEVLIAGAIREADPRALAVIAPRHAERRNDVAQDLRAAGFIPHNRSAGPFAQTAADPRAVLIIDTTGELRDWTAHAGVVIIGKSFLSTGGQNPAEAILARKPVIFGPHMENFQPLSQRLAGCGGAICVPEISSLVPAIRDALEPSNATRMTQTAAGVLARHDGATRRIVTLLMIGTPR